jgi:putative two-component system response regulator
MKYLDRRAGNFTTFRKLRHSLLDLKDDYDLERKDFAVLDVLISDYKNYVDSYGTQFCLSLIDRIALGMEEGGLDPEKSCMVGKDLLMSLCPFEDRKVLRDFEERVITAVGKINEIEGVPCRPDVKVTVKAYSEMSYMERLMLLSHHRARGNGNFSIEEMQLCMQEFRKFFQVVRLVNPSEMREIFFDAQGHVQSSKHNCYEVWRRDGRCENCTSARSCTQKRSFVKFEFIEDDMFFIISQPVIVDGKSFVLELVRNVSASMDEGMMERIFGNEEFMEKVARANRTQYRDELTGLRNREYYAEQAAGLSVVAVAVLKLDNLEEIREIYGEETARRSLKAFAEQVSSEAPTNAEVLRYDEDELMLMMDYVSYADFYQLLSDVQGKLRWAAEDVHSGLELNVSISGVYGYGIARELAVNALKTMHVMEDSEENLVVKHEED